MHAIASARHILLITDERIDGDTMGSTLGLFHVLVAGGYTVSIFSPKPLPEQLAFLPGVQHIRRDKEVFFDKHIDLAIVCDNSDGVFLPPLRALFPHHVPLVCVDHHNTNPYFGDINLIEPAPSTAEVAYRFVRASKLPVPQAAAQCFLTGICTDTILFSTSGTNETTFALATELMERGALLAPIVKNTLMNKTSASLRLWGIALSRLFYDADLDATATVITQNDLVDARATEDDIKALSNYLNEILDKSHEVVAVYYERADGSVKVSLRSRSRNVAHIAQTRFGGGGHQLAAAFSVPNAHLKETSSGFWQIIRHENVYRTGSEH